MNLNTEHPTGDERGDAADGLLELSDDTLETLSGGNDPYMGSILDAEQELVSLTVSGDINVTHHYSYNYTFVVGSAGAQAPMTPLTDMNGKPGDADPLVSGRAPVPVVPMKDGKKKDRTANITQNTRDADSLDLLMGASAR